MTLIHDVTELQAMNNDLAGDYELANDIDASATATWNQLNNRGVWAPATLYTAPLDYITYGGNPYYCWSTHTSAASWTPTEASKWSVTDMAATDYMGFDPIGRAANDYFSGTLDGKGYSITGLYICRRGRREDQTALIFDGGSGCVIHHLHLVNCEIHGSEVVAGIVADLGDWVTKPDIHDCTSSGILIGEGCIGGLIGWCWGIGADISDCSSSCNIEIIAKVCWQWNEPWMVGGLIGSASGNLCQIVRCFATGNILDDKSTNLIPADDFGGLIGFASGSGQLISQCYATGNVTSACEEIGGLIGSISGAGDVTTVQDCYARGNVNGSGYDDGSAGGLIGYIFAGNLSTQTISNCYSTGQVSPGINQVTGGGLIGYKYASGSGVITITNCFWDTQTSGQALSDGGTGKTTAQMKTKTTFSGWDFSSIWSITTYCNDGYPCLLNTTPNCALIPSIQGPQVREIIALEAMRNIEMSCMGRVYVDEEGNLTYESRYARNP